MEEDAFEAAKAIDAALARDLRTVGVHDLRELRAIGAAEAWERLLRADLRDSLRARLQLEAAELGTSPGLLDPGVRERCASHVRRRIAAEPVRRSGSTRFTVAPLRRDAGAERDRRRVLIAAWAFAVPVIVFLVAKILV